LKNITARALHFVQMFHQRRTDDRAISVSADLGDVVPA
jgi:hypothetical protein